MNWKKLTLAHFQALYPITKNKNLTPEDRDIQLICILYNIPETQVDSMPVDKFKELRRSLSFLSEIPDQKPALYLRGKKRKYQIIYNPEQMYFSRYVETKAFKGGNEDEFIANLHKFTASIVQPLKKNIWGRWVPDKYDAVKHPEYAEDLQEANFLSVYHAAVFFYLLYYAWIRCSPTYFTSQLKKMRCPNPEEMYQALLIDMDGFIQQNKLPNLKESVWKRLGISQPYTPSMTLVT
jgi:hypothetical protein